MAKLVYLCGPITGLSYAGATDWRTKVKEALLPDIEVLSPLRAKKFLRTATAIGDHYPENVMATQKAITTRDRFDTQRADMLFVNLLGAERVSIGSMIELGWADSARVPMCVVMDGKNLHDHAMVRELAGWIVPTIDEGIHVVKSVLTPGI